MDQFGAACFGAFARSLDAMAAFGAQRAGEGSTIGIVDTAAGLPPDQAEAFAIEEGEDYCETDERDPTGHGTMVFGAAEQFAKGATFRFYRLFGDGPVRSTDLLLPLRDASTHDVDVLNVSAGFRHQDGGNIRLRETIETLSSDLLVVAAAGNRGDDPDEAVNYPARYRDVLSVGGYVSRCRGSVGQGQTDRRLWADTSARRGFPERQGPFCCQRGCSAEQDCGADRHETRWDGNVQPAAGKPDVYAPPHVPQGDEEGPFLVPGTSFATPMVAGIAAWLSSEGSSRPDPPTLKRAIRTTAVPIHDDTKKLNARLARQRLS